MLLSYVFLLKCFFQRSSTVDLHAPCRSRTTSLINIHLMKSFMATHVTFLILEFLDVCVTLIQSRLIEANLTHKLTHAFFLVSNLILKVSWCMICILIISPPLAMLFSMKIIFLLITKHKAHTLMSLLHLLFMITPFRNQYQTHLYPLIITMLSHI